MVPFWIAGAGLVLVTTAAWVFVIASSGRRHGHDAERRRLRRLVDGDDGGDDAPVGGAVRAPLRARSLDRQPLPGFSPPAISASGHSSGSRRYALDRALGMDHPTATAAVLIAAGLYQLSPLKQACLKRCRSPVDLPRPALAPRPGRCVPPRRPSRRVLPRLLHRAHGGARRRRRHGARLGGRDRLVVAAEKLLPHGPLLGKIGGVGLIAAGIVVAL